MIKGVGMSLAPSSRNSPEEKDHAARFTRGIENNIVGAE